MISFDNDYGGFVDRFGERLNSIFSTYDLHFTFITQDDPYRFADANNTPFATNPHCSSCQIVYNDVIINNLGLNEQEVFACVAHEIGHHIFLKEIESRGYDSTKKEIICDGLATELGLQFHLISALIKMSKNIPADALSDRILSLSESVTIYRPEWTCGRFNESEGCAIMYNLVAGMSYYFEEESAAFIGFLLSKKRWQIINVLSMSQELNADIISTYVFLSQLIDVGLVALRPYSDEAVRLYREEMQMIRIKSLALGKQKQGHHSNDAFERSEAEELYLEKSGICGAVMLELTYRCSEKCIHCYNPGATRSESEVANRGQDSEELHFEEYVSIIDDLYDNGLFKVCLSGGDPFSKSCFWQVLEYLFEKNIAVDIFTNGLGLSGFEDKLGKFYPRTIGLSIYSLLPNTHDGITRVPGSLETTMRVARNISKLSIPEYIKCCVMKNNMGSYSTVYAFASEIGATVQVDMNVSDAIDGDRCVSRYLKPSESDYKVLLQDPRAIMYVGLDTISPSKIDQANHKRVCKAGIRSFCVSPTGELLPCCALHLVLGNLKESSIAEIVNKSDIYLKWISLRLVDFKKCVGCEDIDFCPLCPGFNYSENKNVLIPSRNNCDIAKFRHNVYRDLQVGIKSENTICDMPCSPDLHRVI